MTRSKLVGIAVDRSRNQFARLNYEATDTQFATEQHERCRRQGLSTQDYGEGSQGRRGERIDGERDCLCETCSAHVGMASISSGQFETTNFFGYADPFAYRMVLYLQAAADVGIKVLPPTLTESLVEDPGFLKALYHVLMNVHLVKGMLTCPVTGREFPVTDGIPNMMLEEEECERVRL